jgi:hypothetical protein
MFARLPWQAADGVPKRMLDGSSSATGRHFYQRAHYTDLGNTNMNLSSPTFGWTNTNTGGAGTGQVAARQEF